MFKGWKGFLYVGGYMIPIIIVILFFVYCLVHKRPDYAWLDAINFIWIIDAWKNNVTSRKLQDAYIRVSIINSILIAYIKSLPEHDLEITTNSEKKDE